MKILITIAIEAVSTIETRREGLDFQLYLDHNDEWDVSQIKGYDTIGKPVLSPIDSNIPSLDEAMGLVGERVQEIMGE